MQLIENLEMVSASALVEKAHHNNNIKVLAEWGIQLGPIATIGANLNFACPDNPSALCLNNPESGNGKKSWTLTFLFQSMA